MKKVLSEAHSKLEPKSQKEIDLKSGSSDNEEVLRLSKDGVKRFLREETLFHGASSEALERLTEIAVQKIVLKDNTLFAMGQPCDALHFVVEGCGLLVQTAPDGRQRILHRASAGDMVGCVALLKGKEYPATFIAESECVILSFPRDRLMGVFAKEPMLSLSVMNACVERLRMMASLVESMSFDDTEHRLWDFLVEASTNSGASNFPRVLDPMPTREHIANAIGTVREVVSRRLSRLADSGHLKIDGRRLILLKPLK